MSDEEIVLTRADRLDDDKQTNEAEEVHHKIFITPLSDVPPLPLLMGHLIQEIAINEMRQNEEVSNVKPTNEHKSANNVKPTNEHKSANNHKSASNVKSTNEHKQTNNIHSMKAGHINTINTTNDEIKRSIVKYYSLLICLIILISISSMIFIRLMREKQHYEVLTSKNNI